MKIGIVCPYNMFRGGGVQECVLAMKAELKRRGHEVWIITPMPRGSTEFEADDTIFLGGAAQLKSFHTTGQVSASVNMGVVEDVLNEYQFDILHFHEPWIPIVSRQIMTRSKAINVGTFHAKLPDTIMSRTIERVVTPYTKSILSYLHGFTAVSEPAAEYVRVLTEHEIRIIPNGIDLRQYKPAKEISAHPPTVLYIGRLEKRKGVNHLLAAFQLLQVQYTDARLQIAGDGPDREKLENMVDDLELQNVEFLGFISQEDKIHLLQQADVFCSPAMRGESFGIVLLEAMACGTPIVAGDNPGYKSVMQERGKLSIVSPEDTADFARRLELMMFDAEVRKLWRSWALEYVKQFDYRKVVDGYEAYYQKLLAEK
jgi:phosphatidylinositol alpha-mannosyltransferase